MWTTSGALGAMGRVTSVGLVTPAGSGNISADLGHLLDADLRRVKTPLHGSAYRNPPPPTLPRKGGERFVPLPPHPDPPPQGGREIVFISARPEGAPPGWLCRRPGPPRPRPPVR